jgi:hypothetical protein
MSSRPQTQLRFQTEMRAHQSEATPVELTNRLPFKRVQFGGIDIVELMRERYGRCRISSSVRRLIETPCAIAGWSHGGRSAPNAFSE